MRRPSRSAPSCHPFRAECSPSSARACRRSTPASAPPTSSTGASPTRCCSSSSPTRGSAPRSRLHRERTARSPDRSESSPMTLAELRQIEARSVIPSYARQPVEFVRGEGARLWDDDGNEYLDFLCGISVTNLGHCHPRVVAAVREQVGRLMHVSNLFYTEPAMRLADRLAKSSLGGKAYLCNSGAEATEAAIKLARKAKPQGDVVVVHGAFHGR